jgi:hypothetical protein
MLPSLQFQKLVLLQRVVSLLQLVQQSPLLSLLALTAWF